MRRSTLWMCALLVTTTFGCDKVKKQAGTIGTTVSEKIAALRERFFHKKAPAAPVAATPAPPPPPPPAPALPPEPVQQVAVANPPRARDVPYFSQDTGTVFPGMAERDVYMLWGKPAAIRTIREYTYLFFENGCEHSCGTMDVVTLQNGQVVDAIVRWPGHGYGGESSSPVGGKRQAPTGGTNLQMAPEAAPMTPDTVPMLPDTVPMTPDTVPMTPDPQAEPPTP